MRPATPILACALAAALLACGGPPAPKGPGGGGGGGALVAATDPGLITLDTESTAGLVPAETASQLAVRIRVSAGDLPAGERPPLNLTLVLDTSGSMEGEAIAAARAAARDLVGRMTARDRLAVVIFHSTAEVLVPSTPLTDAARVDVDARLAGIEARGTTAMADGLALGLQQSAAGRAEGTIDRIVLLGDGVPNDPTPIPGLIAQARGQAVSITTLGLGIEFDPLLLGAIATETGGVYRYLDEPEAVARVFDDELVRMQQVVGRNLQLQLRAGPGVTIEPVPGFSSNGQVQWAMLGDLAAGEVRDVIVPVQVTGRRDGASVELIDAVLTFEDAAGGSGLQERTGYAAAKASSDPAAVAASVRVAIELARERARAAGAILQAITQARGGDLAGATATLDAAEAEAREAADAHGDADLRALADQMVELRRHLPDLVEAALAIPDHSSATSAPAAAEESLRRAHDAATRAIDPR